MVCDATVSTHTVAADEMRNNHVGMSKQLQPMYSLWLNTCTSVRNLLNNFGIHYITPEKSSAWPKEIIPKFIFRNCMCRLLLHVGKNEKGALNTDNLVSTPAYILSLPCFS